MFLKASVCFGFCLASNLLTKALCDESKPIFYLNMVHCKFSIRLGVEAGLYTAVNKLDKLATKLTFFT